MKRRFRYSAETKKEIIECNVIKLRCRVKYYGQERGYRKVARFFYVRNQKKNEKKA